MKVRAVDEGDLQAILTITNDAILTSTAIYEYEPRTPAQQRAWIDAKTAGGWPVLVAENEGEVLGFAAFAPFRDKPAYASTVEHSVYVAAGRQGAGVGRRLMDALIGEARVRGLHAMIGGIDASNQASLAFHRALGFREVGQLPEVAWKFGRWLDLIFMQKLL